VSFTIMCANSTPAIDPRTGAPFRFTNLRAAKQQAIALGMGIFRVAPIELR
jgi:hypothetical protein